MDAMCQYEHAEIRSQLGRYMSCENMQKYGRAAPPYGRGLGVSARIM
jgi:hypothetical protein